MQSSEITGCYCHVLGTSARDQGSRIQQGFLYCDVTALCSQQEKKMMLSSLAHIAPPKLSGILHLATVVY